jgi:hypothetical protein
VGKRWSRSKKQFGENPATMSKLDVLYFGYKYYFNPPQKASSLEIEEHFRQSKPSFPKNIDSELSLSLGGDLMPYELINPQTCKHLWDELGDWFFDADIVTANLETPIDRSRNPSLVPEVMLNDMNFNSSEEQFEVFRGSDFDILSLANNHMLDQGENGLLATMDYLDEKGVPFIGSSRSKSHASCRILERNGIKIGFMAFTYSMNQYLPINGKEHLTNFLPLNEENCDLRRIKEQCKSLKEDGADVLFIHLHYGNAYQKYPCDNSIELFHRLHDECGIDFIAGGHPHNPQPLESYPFVCPFTGLNKNGYAVYSLGDFIAYDIFKWCMIPQMLKVHFTRINGSVKVVNIEQKIGFLELSGSGELRLRELYNPNIIPSTLVEGLRDFTKKLKLE